MEERLSKRHRTALDPADFVGKVIDHRFKEPDGSLSWYRGIIEKQIGGRNIAGLLKSSMTVETKKNTI